MQYRKDKKGRDISLLGYGCMRFTRKGGGTDLDKAEREVTAAIEGGVNYLDTAYIYSGNEAAVGEILRRNGRRDQVYLATKLPHYLIKSVEGAEKIFREELRRRGVDQALWEEAMEEMPDPAEILDKLIQKRCRGDLSDPRERRRTSDALLRRGFAWRDVKAAMGRYAEMEEDGWE